MRKRRIILILIAVALLVCLGAAVFWPSREPNYGGKRLSKWVEGMDPINFGENNRTQALGAISHIGPGAVPYLIKWIQYEQPASKAKLFEFINDTVELVHWPWTIYDDNESRARGSEVAFGAFEKQSGLVLPQLTGLWSDQKTSGGIKAGVLVALGNLGEDAAPTLLAVLTNQQAAVGLRLIAAAGLKLVRTNAAPAVPGLIACLDDKDVFLAASVAGILSRLKVEPTVVVPRLIQALEGTNSMVRAMALYSLRNYGSEARAAVPVLLKMLNDKNVQNQGAAKTALLAIDPAALEPNRPE